MPIRSYDGRCMEAAIAQSQQAVAHGCMPFGAVLADASGNILLEAANGLVASKKRGGSTGDVTRHAEMELIRQMNSVENAASCTIYASTEPCVMCAGAIYWSGVSRVVYGCSSASLEELSGPGGFDIPVEQLYSMGRPGMRPLEIAGPLLAEEALQVHRESGVWNTNKGPSTNTTGQKDMETERSLHSIPSFKIVGLKMFSR